MIDDEGTYRQVVSVRIDEPTHKIYGASREVKELAPVLFGESRQQWLWHKAILAIAAQFQQLTLLPNSFFLFAPGGECACSLHHPLPLPSRLLSPPFVTFLGEESGGPLPPGDPRGPVSSPRDLASSSWLWYVAGLTSRPCQKTSGKVELTSSRACSSTCLMVVATVSTPCCDVSTICCEAFTTGLEGESGARRKFI